MTRVEKQDLTNTAEAGEETIPVAEEFVEILESQGLESHAKAYQKVLEIARVVQDAGGQALLVGGSVRDMVMNKISKDYDIEIYGLEPEKIEQIVASQGKVSDVGKAFGILKVSLDEGIDIDISLPRFDSKIGDGHKGFEIKADPNMSIKDAARRRDFTMNSISADPLTGKINDPFGGVQDIKDRIIRVTDLERFRDDPLRVLRAIQFMGRFGMSLDEKSAELIQEMVPELNDLPRERIFEEWKKLLLKSEKPSLGLIAGMNLGVLSEIHPQFPPLTKTKQEPDWHPEGDAWVHTLMSVDSAAEIIDREEITEDRALVVMLATLCHDLGKPDTTSLNEAGQIISHGHEPAGEEPTKEFLKSLGADNKTRDKVLKLVTNHMAPSMLYIDKVIKGKKVGDGAIRKLAKRIHPATIQELVAVAMADHLGRGPFTDPEVPEQLLLSDGFPAGPWLLDWSRRLGVETSKPADLIRGRDLILLGFKPGKNVGQVVKLANSLRDDKGLSESDVFGHIAILSPGGVVSEEDENQIISGLAKVLEEK